MTGLHTISRGTGPEQLVFLHGLFGQGKNFATIARLLADQATSLMVDLPNHGRSPWTEHFDYDLFADIVANELVERGAGREPVTLIGHSMGGKVAMRLALLHPKLIKRLVIEDISPVDRRNVTEFRHLIYMMLGLDLDAIHTRSDADAALRDQIANAATRAFLLQNLQRTADEEHWHWQVNLKLLERDLDRMADWAEIQASWDGPVLWLSGERSAFISPATEPVMRRYFPNTELVEIADAGHWGHADQSRAVADAIAAFISRH